MAEKVIQFAMNLINGDTTPPEMPPMPEQEMPEMPPFNPPTPGMMPKTTMPEFDTAAGQDDLSQAIKDVNVNANANVNVNVNKGQNMDDSDLNVDDSAPIFGDDPRPYLYQDGYDFVHWTGLPNQISNGSKAFWAAKDKWFSTVRAAPIRFLEKDCNAPLNVEACRTRPGEAEFILYNLKRYLRLPNPKTFNGVVSADNLVDNFLTVKVEKDYPPIIKSRLTAEQVQKVNEEVATQKRQPPKENEAGTEWVKAYFPKVPSQGPRYYGEFPEEQSNEAGTMPPLEVIEKMA